MPRANRFFCRATPGTLHTAAIGNRSSVACSRSCGSGNALTCYNSLAEVSALPRESHTVYAATGERDGGIAMSVWKQDDGTWGNAHGDCGACSPDQVLRSRIMPCGQLCSAFQYCLPSPGARCGLGSTRT